MCAHTHTHKFVSIRDVIQWLDACQSCTEALKLVTFLKSRGKMLAQKPEEALAKTVNLGAQHTEKQLLSSSSSLLGCCL